MNKLVISRKFIKFVLMTSKVPLALMSLEDVIDRRRRKFYLFILLDDSNNRGWAKRSI